MAKPERQSENVAAKPAKAAGVRNSGKNKSADVGKAQKTGPAKAKKDKGSQKPSGKKSKNGAEKVQWIDKARQFLREVKVELRKVTWPSRKEAMGTTAVVLVLVGILALYLGLVDAGLTKALTTVMR